MSKNKERRAAWFCALVVKDRHSTPACCFRASTAGYQGPEAAALRKRQRPLISNCPLHCNWGVIAKGSLWGTQLLKSTPSQHPGPVLGQKIERHKH